MSLKCKETYINHRGVLLGQFLDHLDAPILLQLEVKPTYACQSIFVTSIQISFQKRRVSPEFGPRSVESGRLEGWWVIRNGVDLQNGKANGDGVVSAYLFDREL